MGFSRQSPGVGCHFLLQGIFPTQGLNLGLPHCRQALNCLSHRSFQMSQFFASGGQSTGASASTSVLPMITQSCSLLRWTDSVQFTSVQSLSHVRLFATACIAARQATLSITDSRSSLTLMSIELVMPSSHLILCRPLLLLPTIPPSIRVFQ